MDESSRNVQIANAHSSILHTQGSTQSAGRWMKVQGMFKMQAHIIGVVMDITAFKVSHSSGIDIDATALRAARMRSSSIGALDKRSRNVQKANTHAISLRQTQGTQIQFSGAMDESSGKVQRCK